MTENLERAVRISTEMSNAYVSLMMHSPCQLNTLIERIRDCRIEKLELISYPVNNKNCHGVQLDLSDGKSIQLTALENGRYRMMEAESS